jgi:hypothetical protein
MGEIDLDPASCVAAQQVVGATTYYTRADDGLRQPWYGRVFLNPPYKMPDVARFGGKLIEELDAGHTTEAIVLVNSVTQTDWFQYLGQRAEMICFPDGKIPFTHATRDDSAGPCYGQALLYFGPHVERFVEVFEPMGFVSQPRRGKEHKPQLDLAAPTPPEPRPPPAHVAQGTIAEQMVQVLRGAPDGLTNAQIAKAIGKKQTDTFKPLERLTKYGTLRQEGTLYVYVACPQQQESAHV